MNNWQIFEVDRDFEPSSTEAEKIAQEKSGHRFVHRINDYDDWVLTESSPYKPKSGLENAFIEGLRKYKIREYLYWIFICWD